MLSLENNACFVANLYVLSDTLFLYQKKTPSTCFWPLLKMSLQLFVVFCIKAEVVFGHKICEKLNLLQYFLKLATLYTQAMYQKSFNTKILQIITCCW